MTKEQIDEELKRLKAERSRIERRIDELKNAKRAVGDCVYYFENGKHVLALRPSKNRISDLSQTRRLVSQGSKTLFISETEKLVSDLNELLDRIKGKEIEA